MSKVNLNSIYPLDIGCQLSVDQTFRRSSGCPFNVRCTFNLGPLSRAFMSLAFNRAFNLQLPDSPNSGHLQITDKRLKSEMNYYKLLMEKPPNSGH